jgi:hypothetical protein
MGTTDEQPEASADGQVLDPADVASDDQMLSARWVAQQGPAPLGHHDAVDGMRP